MGRIEGKVAIVTGAASGIGAGVASRFLAEGASVLAVDRAPAPAPGTDGARFDSLQVDLAQPDAAARIANRCIERFGAIDILANNAGICDYRLLEDTDDATWDRAIAINLTAMFKLCRATAAVMKARGWGRIINTASIMAERPYPSLTAYTASKHAVAGLTKSVAIELGAHGITANYILPGAVLTGITAPLIAADPTLRETYDTMGVVNRMAMPEDIANAFLFLASDEASFITGHGLAVDGGALLKM
ncbi:SDR family NAD(P)-dependent oxidoreductase [Novosphingobium mangrovi (ex Huang et al. 2023)]|uniref:SDR family oxidoreductase n=1 Tax=Novosphingobium mangrovi (ex Huang et al. 2023) TaxID=2976432 RepID=A0ABT2I3C4_9SPHN|nr:SDR family NAD(P)-dependent oxidoreductase [Novosphingobium mangrovi (ex Huang et al. 2023)]MCT2399311.1 SDR family oxidoreductase [Novosphingobium mangrovi (ex Huang et al. 2023)]